MYCLLLYILLILTFLYIKATSKDRDERYCYSYFVKEENKILKTFNLPYRLVSDRTRLRCRLTNSKFSLFTTLDIRKPIYWFFIMICHSVKWTLTHYAHGEGNGNPLQYFCLENPRDRGAVHRIAQSQTWLKQLSRSSSSIMLRF